MKRVLFGAVAAVLPATISAFGASCACPTCPEPAAEDKGPTPPIFGGPVDCAEANPQSPRDVTAGSAGDIDPLVAPHGTEVVAKLHHVNTHYHLGAEHKSAGEYDDPTIPSGNDFGIQSGFFCKTLHDTLDAPMLAPYDFQYCTKTEVGNTYEFHWVYSTAGKGLGPGLGGAFARQHNPTAIVRGQVFVVVNDASGANDHDMLLGTDYLDLADSIHGYIGSTTGPSFNNEDTCSPYHVNWHVDPKCQIVSAQSLDQMCKSMKYDHDMEADAHPHGSRELVIAKLSSSDLMVLN